MFVWLSACLHIVKPLIVACRPYSSITRQDRPQLEALQYPPINLLFLLGLPIFHEARKAVSADA